MSKITSFDPPPKANRIKIRSKTRTGNEFYVWIDGEGFTGNYEINLKLPPSNRNTSGIITVYTNSSSQLSTNGWITSDYLKNNFGEARGDISPIPPGDSNLPTTWCIGTEPTPCPSPPSAETTGFLQKLINSFKQLFGLK